MQKAIDEFERTLISRGLSEHTIIAYKRDLLQLQDFLMKHTIFLACGVRMKMNLE